MRLLMRDACQSERSLGATLDSIIAGVEAFRGAMPISDDRVLLGVVVR
jgi:hypothetical protein